MFFTSQLTFIYYPNLSPGGIFRYPLKQNEKYIKEKIKKKKKKKVINKDIIDL